VRRGCGGEGPGCIAVSAARDSRRALWTSDWWDMLCLLFWLMVPTRSVCVVGNDDVRVLELGLMCAMLRLCLMTMLSVRCGAGIE
jgi:hypothetical protein